MKNAFLKILFLLVFMASCVKNQVKLPLEPVLTYDTLTESNDTLIVKMTIQDGDANFGFADASLKDGKTFNLFVDYFEKDSGVFKKITLTPPLHAYITALKPEGNNKPLIADFFLKLGGLYYNPLLDKGDSVKYEIYVIDRLKNMSNTVVTDILKVK